MSQTVPCVTHLVDPIIIKPLDDVIQNVQNSLRVLPQDHEDQSRLLMNLGIYLKDRYSKLHKLNDLEISIQSCKQALSLSNTPGDFLNENYQQAKLLSNLGQLLYNRYQEFRIMADIDAAIQYSEASIKKTPATNFQHTVRLGLYSSHLACRHMATRSQTDIDLAVELVRKGIDMTTDEHPHHLSLQLALVDLFEQRYQSAGSMDDLNDLIHIRKDVRDLAATDHTIIVPLLHGLAQSLGHRYSKTGQAADLDEAIEISEKCISYTHENDSHRAKYLYGYANLLSLRHSQSCNENDLEKAIQTKEEAIGATVKYGQSLIALKNQFQFQFEQTRDKRYIEEAIRVAQQAVDSTPSWDPNRFTYLFELGLAVYSRSCKSWPLDIAQAIELHKKAIAVTPSDFPHLDIMLCQLGIEHDAYYLGTNKIDELNSAISVGRQALEKTPNDNLDRMAFNSNALAHHLEHRYSVQGNLLDLEEAIRISHQVVSSTSECHPNRVGRLYHLGELYHSLHSISRDISDFEEAIRWWKSALDISTSAYISQNMALGEHDGRLDGGVNSNSLDRNLDVVLNHFQSAIQDEHTWPIFRFEIARRYISCCAAMSRWDDAYQVVKIAVSLLPELILRPILNSQKQHNLGQMAEFASDAAAVAMQAGDDGPMALSILEQGRSLQSKTVGHSTFTGGSRNLHSLNPELYQKLESIKHELHAHVPYSGSIEDYEFHWRDRKAQPYVGSENFQVLVAEIRKLTDNEGFLKLAPTEIEMREAARSGPIIFINMSALRCDAILVTQDRISIKPLPLLKYTEAEEMVLKHHPQSPRMLEWLWEVVAEPSLNALQFTQAVSDGEWPRVWWIATGPLRLLPIHAAGYHQIGSSQSVLDRVMSSYSSSISAIIMGRKRPIASLETPGKAVFVATEHKGSSHSQRLPFVSEEVVRVRDLCKSANMEIIDTEQDLPVILKNLLGAKIFHFAGHGSTDNHDPSASHLVLEEIDGYRHHLPVGNILRMSLHENPPFLAYLSACGTGRIRARKFLDESVHLISAFQILGFRHVMGTLWEVIDETCMQMATMVYTQMMKGELTDETVCAGLHHASRTLRDRWLNQWDDQERGTEVANPKRSALDGKSRMGLLRELDETEYEEEEAEISRLQWVPFVHFGV